MTAASFFDIISCCRACGSKDLSLFYSTQSIPVAGIYYSRGDVNPDVNAPMSLANCCACGLVQLLETISPTIYADYSFVGDSSSVYFQHLQKVAQILSQNGGLSSKRVFEVGASNGVLLDLLKDKGAALVAGIEPSSKLCEDALSRNIKLDNGFFDDDYLSGCTGAEYDCVIIRHVLEHIDHLNDFVGSAVSLMGQQAELVIEVPDWEQIVEKKLFSNIFHEHLNYFSVETLDRLLARHRLKPVLSEKVDIHGGSIFRIYRFGENTHFPVTVAMDTLTSFGEDARRYYLALGGLARRCADAGTVHGYGASHRTFVLLGNSKISQETLPVIYDNNPFLHGRLLNGPGIVVMEKERLLINDPDFILLFAISYEDEIRRLLKNKGYSGHIYSARYDEICTNPSN
jgi:hypothetical protein